MAAFPRLMNRFVVGTGQGGGGPSRARHCKIPPFLASTPAPSTRFSSPPVLFPSFLPLLQERSHNSTLVLAEHDGKSVSQATLSAVTAAKSLNKQIIGVVTPNDATDDFEKICSDLSMADGVDEVIACADDKLNHFMADSLASFLVQVINERANSTSVSTLIAPLTSISRDVFPRVAGRLDVQPLSDVTKIEAPNVFHRFMYAGNIAAKFQSKDKLIVLTIRPTAFPPTQMKSEKSQITRIKFSGERSMMTFVSEEKRMDDLPQLGTAKVVVSGGRALKNKENFQKLLEPLRAKLNAAMGASRAAVDSGLCPNDLQVGQTGKIVAPSLYIAVGISGAIQHISGMKDSKVIVAINRDADAPIFQVATYGLVGDLYTILPELTSKLSQQ